jgi:hypothetical protein
MGERVSFSIEDGQLKVNLGDFVSRFAEALPPLVAWLRSPQFRAHPKWGELMPFDVPCFGRAPSPGHCVRADVIPTPDGPRICELDFVTGGRGPILATLAPGSVERARYLGPFADWYRSICADSVAYATGTTTGVYTDTVQFATELRESMGVPIRAVNIDRDPVDGGTLIDRLFYRSELAAPLALGGNRVVTAEPWLDSKMVFAVVHDPGMTRELTAVLGAENLAFLRDVMIETYSLADVRAHRREFLADHVLGRPADWVVKNSDVETDTSWGSRGVLIGRKYSKEVFARAVLEGAAPGRTGLGGNPVLQRFVQSNDLHAIWDAAVAGMVPLLRPAQSGHHASHVFGKVGFFFLLSNATGETFTPRTGWCALREDELAHGAPDAQRLAVTAVLRPTRHETQDKQFRWSFSKPGPRAAGSRSLMMADAAGAPVSRRHPSRLEDKSADLGPATPG